MGASNRLAFLPLFAILGWLGLITSWFLKRAGVTKLGLEPVLGKLNLEFLSELTSYGMEPFLLIRLTFPGFRKIRPQLRVATVTLTFGSTAQNLLQYHPIGGDERLISAMTTGVTLGTNRLINNFCVKFSLVV